MIFFYNSYRKNLCKFGEGVINLFRNIFNNNFYWRMFYVVINEKKYYIEIGELEKNIYIYYNFFGFKKIIIWEGGYFLYE